MIRVCRLPGEVRIQQTVFSPSQAARLLDVTRGTVIEWSRTDIIRPWPKHGRWMLFTAKAISDCLETIWTDQTESEFRGLPAAFFKFDANAQPPLTEPLE